MKETKKSPMRYWTKEDYANFTKQVHQNAVEHGWHNPTPSMTTCMMLIITEAAEAVEAWRKDKRADLKEYLNIVARPNENPIRDFSKVGFHNYIKGTVEEELADICIRIFDLCAECKFEIRIPDGVVDQALILHTNRTMPEMIYETIEFLYYEVPYQARLISILTSVIAISELMDIDLPAFIQIKMKYNKTREYKHGNKKV